MVSKRSTAAISLILPSWNEEKSLPDALARIQPFLPAGSEILVVDDASTDQTASVAQSLGANVIQLPRNTRKEGATKIGLMRCQHSTALVMDCDLEHPPELIPCLLAALHHADIAEGEKTPPHMPWTRRTANSLFHRMLEVVSQTKLGKGACDFKALGPKALEAYRQQNPPNPFFRLDCHRLKIGGQTPKIAKIPFTCGSRNNGPSRWGIKTLTLLALQAFRNGRRNP